jgi:hypothetical protein
LSLTLFSPRVFGTAAAATEIITKLGRDVTLQRKEKMRERAADLLESAAFLLEVGHCLSFVLALWYCLGLLRWSFSPCVADLRLALAYRARC